ncbi:MAG: hypothetical protein HC901_01015 [Bdellovibrionaceae bacterium]|nr:hypothetical protein [Pseudobdellovibrionaceae bacterium]
MQIPYEVKPRPDTGLYNAKVGIWLFLASEVMLFGGLFAGYVFLRLGALPGTWPSNVQMVEPGLLNTAILIASSVTVVLAWASVKLNNFRAFKIYMGITLLCSLLFLGLKAVEYNKKFHHYGAYLRDDRDPKGWSIQVTGHRLHDLEDEQHYVLQADKPKAQPWHWHSSEVDGEYIYPIERFDRFDFQHSGVTILPSDAAAHGKKQGAADKHDEHAAPGQGITPITAPSSKSPKTRSSASCPGSPPTTPTSPSTSP